MTKIKRSAGILMPISALPSSYGIGTFGKAAYDFVDYLKNASQKLWQVLPLGPTSYGDSPYQSFSAFAGNPYFIDLDMLINDGLLTKQDLKCLKYSDDTVDYEALYNTRFDCLYKAFLRFDTTEKTYMSFVKSEKFWLEEYSLFMALKQHFDGADWHSYDEKLRRRDKNELKKYRELLAEKIEFYKFLQYEFFTQWKALKKYANKNGVKIIGDIPIYVALDSADTYFNPALFQFDENLNPVRVAGCPPDAFSADGQLWGNPLYDWKKHEQSGYKWWIKRIKHSFRLYDIVRIDHFRGFESYYAIPAENKTAKVGRWEKGPGMRLFNAIKKSLGDVDIIAEDLGFLTPKVYKLLNRSGFCGMKVLQFAFGEMSAKNKYLPHNYNEKCIVYTGTHDNTTTLDYFKGEKVKIKRYILNYLKTDEQNVVEAFIRAAYSSVAVMAVVPMADVLGMDRSGRINVPSTIGGNWIFRIKSTDLTAKSAQKLKQLSVLYDR